jgi:hypothetical protein
MGPLSSKLPTAANLLDFLRLNLSMSYVRAIRLLTDSLSLTYEGPPPGEGKRYSLLHTRPHQP